MERVKGSFIELNICAGPNLERGTRPCNSFRPSRPVFSCEIITLKVISAGPGLLSLFLFKSKVHVPLNGLILGFSKSSLSIGTVEFAFSPYCACRSIDTESEAVPN